MTKLNKETIQVIKKLQNDLQELLKLESNMEVVWKLEELHNQKVLIKSTEHIIKSLNN